LNQRRKDKKRKWFRPLKQGFLIAFSAGCLAACGQTASYQNAKGSAAEYTPGQIMTVAATERNRYQNIYTGQLWSVAADGSGTTFESLLKGQMEQFLTELAAINLLAEEKGVELTNQEKTQVQSLTDTYFSSLTPEDLDYMKVSKDEIYDLYSKYYLADKTVSQLTDEKALEVSDAEAKVIRILQIETDTEEKAETLWKKVNEPKADFASIAEKESGGSQVEFQLEWSDTLNALEETAFSLEQDQISEIISWEGKFYIQKCISAYDEEATAARKLRLLEEKKARAFDQIYTPFIQNHPIRLKNGIWEGVDFSQGEKCTSDDFFQLYHEMGE
jgi:foldase protein PrsA